MKRLSFQLFVFFLSLSLYAHGQLAIESGANQSGLPLRNLLIEVRQIQQENRASDQVGGAVQAQVQPGQTGIAANISASRSSQDRNASTRQQVLVLNGRSANISLGNSVPLQLIQTVFRNGIWVSVPGTVYLSANTGFLAQPRWDGSGSVELALEAMQSQGVLATASSTSTRLVVALDEWVTVARSDQTLSNRSTQLGGFGNVTGTTQLEIQIRVSLR
jgi:hypothetical protein